MADKVESKVEIKDEKAAPAAGSKKGKKAPRNGVVHIQCTFNNTLVTITNPKGNVVAWSSAGSMNFKGSRKSTPFAAQVAAETAGKKAVDAGMKSVEVYVKGPGSGREAAIGPFKPADCKFPSLKMSPPFPIMDAGRLSAGAFKGDCP